MAHTRVIADPIRYGFAVGRVRVLETRLLSRSHFERLLDAPSFAEQKRVLSETVYGGYLESATTADDVERAVDRALADVYEDFLESANLPASMVRFFRTQHDFENLRGMLKAEAVGIPADELLNDLGSIPAEDFLSGSLPQWLVKVERRVRSAIERDDETLPVDLVDPAVDAEMYVEMCEVAGESTSDHIREIAQLGADLANIKAFLRTRSRNMPVAEAERFFVPCGHVPIARFIALYRLPLVDAAAQLAALPALRVADPAALLDPGRVDVLVDVALARRLRGALMVAIGPEPVIGYVYARRAEASTLRMLLIGKLSGVNTDVLRARLRDVA
ncbi:MAG: V-type ATPase subunit [Coriobacteriia bacterium]|nr:V-type ATPase subunit [Coriobacteriia bacterium]